MFYFLTSSYLWSLFIFSTEHYVFEKQKSWSHFHIYTLYNMMPLHCKHSINTWYNMNILFILFTFVYAISLERNSCNQEMVSMMKKHLRYNISVAINTHVSYLLCSCSVISDSARSYQTHVHWVNDAIQPSHPLFPSPPALNLSQHQGLF